jgi:predicted  nucleic acid-binding Zn-ribbon protein
MALAMVEMTEVRLARLESDVGHIRSDVADLKLDVRELRKEIGGAQQAISGLRGDMQEKIGELRDDMRKEFAIVRRSNLETRIWMLLIGGAMLGVVAHALHWL